MTPSYPACNPSTSPAELPRRRSFGLCGPKASVTEKLPVLRRVVEHVERLSLMIRTEGLWQVVCLPALRAEAVVLALDAFGASLVDLGTKL